MLGRRKGFGFWVSETWGFLRRRKWNEDFCARAAGYGLDFLEYAHENGCPWDKRTCEIAALHGRLDCLKYAHENGCHWDEKTCEIAALHGHLDILKYAHENGCPWDKFTCEIAALHGHLDILKYAHENGCPFIRDCSNVHENVRAYVESVLRRSCPIKVAMTALDDVKRSIPDGQYLAIADGLMHAHRAKKARRQSPTVRRMESDNRTETS